MSWSQDLNYDPTSGGGGLLEMCFFKSYMNGSQTFGEMWSGAINLYIKETSNFGGGDYHTLEEWQPFGDPSLKLRRLSESSPEDNHAPGKPDGPSGSSSGKAGEQYSFNTSVTDQDGDHIYYLFDWDDGTDSGYIGPSTNGTTTGHAMHVWKKDGTFQVKVKAVDMHGFEGPWSKPLNVSVTYLENNYVWLIGPIAYKLETDDSVHFYSRPLYLRTTKYIDFNPPEFKRYTSSGILFSVDPQYFGFIGGDWSWNVFGRFNIQFIYDE